MAITISSMTSEVADLIGGSSDSVASTKALTYLNRAVNHLNMNGIVLVSRKATTFSGGSLTNGQTYFTFANIGADFAWPDDRVFVYDTNNNIVKVGEWRPWEQFQAYINKTDTTDYGVPQYFSILGQSDAKVYFWPYLSTTNVGKITLPYFAKIGQLTTGNFSEDNYEIAEALIQYAQYLIMQYRYKDKPAIWMPWKTAADETMRRAKASAMRFETAGIHPSIIPDEGGSLGAPTSIWPRGAVYIVVGGA